MRFYIVLRNGTKLPLPIVAVDADVAVYNATKKLGIKNVSHAIKA